MLSTWIKPIDMGKVNTRGGSRPNSGQPKKAPTKVITFRVRDEWVAIVKAMVKEKVEQLKKGQV